MLKFLCILSVLFVIASAEKPEYGSVHCEHILAQDCSSFTDEPVCGNDGNTYMNSCEWAHGICSHHGHGLAALHTGPCN